MKDAIAVALWGPQQIQKALGLDRAPYQPKPALLIPFCAACERPQDECECAELALTTEEDIFYAPHN